MQSLQNQRVVVTGGSRGIGLGAVEALVARGAQVTVIARDRARLAEIERPGIAVRPGDATDAAFVDAVVAEVRPSVLILNAGAPPHMAPIDEQTWESFCAVWNTDVRAGLYGMQAALKTPMPPGGRVLVVSGGFATSGAPLGGSSAGAKRTLWFMAQAANIRAAELGLGIRFQALLPLQPPGDSRIGASVAAWFAGRQDVAGRAPQTVRLGAPLPPQQWGEHIVTLLTDPEYADGVAYGLTADPGNAGITRLDS